MAGSFEQAISEIHPDYMSYAVRHPMDIRGSLSLGLARFFNGRRTKVHQRVTAERVHLPGGGERSAIVHRPDGATEPTGGLVWIFGGGLISGNAGHVNSVASTFAAELGIVVVVPDYRLAPEHPYPAAIDDCFSALEWLVSHADALGVDRSRILVGGESAGGGLAASLAQRARYASIPLLLQVLVAPMLDDQSVIRAETNGDVHLVWTVTSNRFAWTAYLGHGPEESESRPYAVPAREQNLGGLAAAWISVGEADLFLEESLEYAGRLTASGVMVDLTTIPGAHHGWELLAPGNAEVLRVRAARLEAMRAALCF